MLFKPMLAARIEDFDRDLPKLRYPVLCSPKLDGIRMAVQGGRLVSRKLKLIPNLYTQKLFSHNFFNGLDGEGIVGESFGEGVFNRSSSGLMSMEGNPPITYHVFDLFCEDHFSNRLSYLKDLLDRCNEPPMIQIVQHKLIENLEQLLAYEEEQLKTGYEGIMIRDPYGPYKQGRSTFREGWLIKLKRFEPGEAYVTGFEELQHNSNEATINELGKTKRSNHQAGMVGMDMLGSFKCRDCTSGVEFNCGSGMTLEQRIGFWQRRDQLTGSVIRYKFLPVGVKDRPRHPIFLGLRSPIDL